MVRLQKMFLMSCLLLAWLYSASCIEKPYEPGTGPGVTFKQASAASVTFKWKVNGSNLDCVMIAPAAGWVAVAFGSGATNHGGAGNLIIGYVDGSGVAHATDENMSILPHTPDSQQDISNITGTETGGATEIHFTIPLNSGDTNDMALIEGQQYYLFTAYCSSDDTTAYHDDRGITQITL